MTKSAQKTKHSSGLEYEGKKNEPFMQVLPHGTVVLTTEASSGPVEVIGKAKETNDTSKRIPVSQLPSDVQSKSGIHNVW